MCRYCQHPTYHKHACILKLAIVSSNTQLCWPWECSLKLCPNMDFISLLPYRSSHTSSWLPSFIISLSLNIMSHAQCTCMVLLPLVIGCTCGVAELRTLVRAARGNCQLWWRYTTPTLRHGSRKLPWEHHHLGCILEDVHQSTRHCCGMEDWMASLILGLFISWTLYHSTGKSFIKVFLRVPWLNMAVD